MKTRIGITSGDLKGVGPEIILKILSDENIFTNFELYPVINKDILSELSQKYKINFPAETKFIEPSFSPDENPSLSSLKSTLSLLKNKIIDAFVTMPLTKTSLKSFTGHTELLEFYDNRISAMMMCGKSFKCILITNHLPIKDISKSISQELIIKKITLGFQSLKTDFKISSPRIAILSLNPHAGENGLLGKEEKEVIIPAIEKLKNLNIDVSGPFPADGFFSENNFKNFDLVAGMYHDQILIPFKYINRDSGVNFTAGLSFVRTSPAHGTAFDIAGKNLARIESSVEAIILADNIFKNRINQNE